MDLYTYLIPTTKLSIGNDFYYLSVFLSRNQSFYHHRNLVSQNLPQHPVIYFVISYLALGKNSGFIEIL